MGNRYGVREITDVVFKDIATGKPVLYLETLKTSSTEVTADSVSARGGAGNPKRVTWDSNKEVKYNMSDALISPEALAMLAGSTVTTGAKAAHKKEVLTVVSSKVTLKETPKTGAKFFVFTTTNGSDIGTELVLTSGYTLSGKEVTIVSGATDGQKIIVDYYYDAPVTTKSIIIDASKFPGYYSVEASTLWRNEATGIDVAALYTMPKIKLMPNFTINNAAEGDPSVFDFNVEAYPDSDGHIEIIDILE